MSDYSDEEIDDVFDYNEEEGYEDDDDAISFDLGPAKQKPGTGSTFEFKSLSAHDLQTSVDSEIRNVSNIIDLDPEITSILLRHFRWDVDKLMDRYMESSDAALQSAGEPDPINNVPKQRDTSGFICGICYDEPPPEQIFSLRCNHRFCKSCWQAYVEEKIKTEAQCTIPCMHEGCRTVITDSSMSSVLDLATMSRYHELLINSFVSARSNLKFCPYPSCTETISSPVGSGSKHIFTSFVPTVTCHNQHSFCFGCNLDSDHRPVVCHWVSMWQKNTREDAGTAQWIKANTRECPKCSNSIEKSGGCNRMLCRHCQYQFCWMCRQNWDVHGYSDTACSIWKEPERDEVMTAATKNLEKWLFYFDRFNNHELSAKLDQALCEATEEKMVEVQEASDLSWIESKFMQHAVDALTQCRLTLKWSYTMAFYLAQGNQKQIFEDLQANLEKAVEDLSQLLEEPIEADTVKDLRKRMMDKTVYVQKRHEILLNDTAAQLAEGKWEWVTPLDA